MELFETLIIQGKKLSKTGIIQCRASFDTRELFKTGNYLGPGNYLRKGSMLHLSSPNLSGFEYKKALELFETGNNLR